MNYQPRTIAFLAELQHPALAPDPRPVQKLHNELFEGGSPPYASFQVAGPGAVLSNPAAQPNAVSQVAFLPDRIQFREELTAQTWESFAERVVTVLTAAAPRLGLEVLTSSHVVLRSLINPRRWADSREFLREAVMGLDEEELESFGRPPGTYGLRLSFPPLAGDPTPVDLRIESYNADPRSLFLEVRASRGPLAVAQGFAALEGHVRGTYRFLTDRALPFVERFDARLPR